MQNWIKKGLIHQADQSLWWSKKYASMLGYNYQSSEWYEKSYKIFNKNYVKETIEKNKKIKKTTLEKIKSLLSFK